MNVENLLITVAVTLLNINFLLMGRYCILKRESPYSQVKGNQAVSAGYYMISGSTLSQIGMLVGWIFTPIGILAGIGFFIQLFGFQRMVMAMK